MAANGDYKVGQPTKLIAVAWSVDFAVAGFSPSITMSRMGSDYIFAFPDFP